MQREFLGKMRPETQAKTRTFQNNTFVPAEQERS